MSSTSCPDANSQARLNIDKGVEIGCVLIDDRETVSKRGRFQEALVSKPEPDYLARQSVERVPALREVINGPVFQHIVVCVVWRVNFNPSSSLSDEAPVKCASILY